MAKSSLVYTCSNCDAQYPKWVGRCTECGKWGSVPQQGEVKIKTSAPLVSASATPINLSNAATDKPRLWFKIKEFDRVSAGLPEGSVTLLTGEPGLGKSTLVLELAAKLGQGVLYVSGEESAEQVAGRLKRLRLDSKNISFINEQAVETIIGTVATHTPTLVIIDSIQTLMSSGATGSPGSPGQIKAVVAQIVAMAKSSNVTALLIGHVTKGGEVAGPKTLEHLVDVVINIEGEKGGNLRILRASKNRFGASDEVGFFEMSEEGMRQVANPSALLLASRHHDPGSCVTAIQQGSRSLLIEVQALVTRSRFGYPKRTGVGFDFNRLQLILAVLQEKAGVKLAYSDVYVNLVGGIKSKEPGLDLAVAMAIVSAYRKKALPKDLLVVGEIGLAGEIRQAKNLSRGLKEAAELGFMQVLTSSISDKEKLPKGLSLVGHKSLSEAVAWFDRDLV